MNPPAPTSPRRAWADWLAIAVFAGLLWLPTVDFFTGVDLTRAPDENRVAAPKPRFTRPDITGLQNYLAASELYFNDHFGFRKRLIRWFQQWKERLYHDNDVVKKGVFTGQHGWLFYGEQQMLEHYLGTLKFTPAQLQSWQKLLEKRRDWLAARGIQYLFVLPPDKQTIYSEKLPHWLQQSAPANRETKLDQLEKYLHEHSTVRVLDLRRPLLAAKATAPIYLENDSHWTLFGGFVACQEIIHTLAADFPDLPPLRQEDFDWTNTPARGGDLARMLGTEPVERNFMAFQPKPGMVAPQAHPATNLALLWHTRNTNIMVDNPAPRKETAVVFHDSYGIAWRSFLGYSFKRVVFIWDNREFNPQIIGEYQPQVVINEMLERSLNTTDPEALMAKEALP